MSFFFFPKEIADLRNVILKWVFGSGPSTDGVARAFREMEEGAFASAVRASDFRSSLGGAVEVLATFLRWDGVRIRDPSRRVDVRNMVVIRELRNFKK